MSNTEGLAKGIKHSTLYASGNIARKLVGFVMLPIYTQYLSPSDYGIIGLLTLSVGLFEIFFGARLLQAVPKFYHSTDNAGERNLVVSTALILTFAVSAIFTVLLIVSRGPLSEVALGTTGFGMVFGLFAILLLTGALEEYGLLYLRLRDMPYTFVILSFMKLVTQLFLNVLLVVYFDWGVLGIATTAAVSSSLFALGLTLYTLYLTKIRFDKSIAIRQIIFCWPLWLGSFAGLYMGSSNRYFLRTFGTLDDIGLLELAGKFSALLVLFIWHPFMQYWGNERFQIYYKDPQTAVFKVVFRAVTAMMLLVGTAVAIFSQFVIEIMAGSAFHDASSIVPILVAATFFSCLASFVDFGYFVADKTIAISQNLYLTAFVATFFYVVLVPLYGLVGAALGLLFTQIFRFLVMYVRSKRYYDMNLDLSYLFVLFVLCGFSTYFALGLNYDGHWLIQQSVRFLVYFGLVLVVYKIYIRDEESKMYLSETVNLFTNKLRRK
ncbi:MAG: oligosaccharide flippase family protein [Pseudomonadales bacterium]